MAVLILDGTRLAAARAPLLATRAARVLDRRGSGPLLLIVGIEDDRGVVPFVQRKVASGAELGITVELLTLAAEVDAAAALGELGTALARRPFDGVFVQVPFPHGFDGDALVEGIPAALDVDVMTRRRIDEYMADPAALPPVTVAAGLALLDAWAVSVEGLDGVVVAEASPFADMFRMALARRGARMQPLVAPGAADLAERAGEAGLVVVAAGSPALVRATQLAPGAVVLDVGYFNTGGVGDVDLTGGAAHLSALSPVPGGIGPMTVSALMERVVLFAERSG
jgi:methylenetetrahydrofolate dehydrogenase (NADP+) / methenyltetrahydrofolate cyclohydrolase